MFDLLKSAHTLPLKKLPRGVTALGVPTPVSVELCDSELRAKREALQASAATGRGVPPSRPPEPGDWRLEVHVIRCASLAPCDTSGTPKAYVQVHWLGQTQRTSADGPRSSEPTWDARLLYTARDVGAAELARAVLSIRVLNAHALGATLIGEFEIACAELYRWPHHELHRQWVVLVDPSRPEAGCMGYCQLSATLLHEGDAGPPARDAEAARAAAAAAGLPPDSTPPATPRDPRALSSPLGSRRRHFVVCAVREAEVPHVFQKGNGGLFGAAAGDGADRFFFGAAGGGNGADSFFGAAGGGDGADSFFFGAASGGDRAGSFYGEASSSAIGETSGLAGAAARADGDSGVTIVASFEVQALPRVDVAAARAQFAPRASHCGTSECDDSSSALRWVRATWDREVWLPCWLPAVQRWLCVSLWACRGGARRLVARCPHPASLDDLARAANGDPPLRDAWINLYGPNVEELAAAQGAAHATRAIDEVQNLEQKAAAQTRASHGDDKTGEVAASGATAADDDNDDDDDDDDGGGADGAEERLAASETLDDPLAEAAARHVRAPGAATSYIGRVRVSLALELLRHPSRSKREAAKLVPKGGKADHLGVAYACSAHAADSRPETARYVLRVAPYLVAHVPESRRASSPTARLEAQLRVVIGGEAMLATRWEPCESRAASWLEDSNGDGTCDRPCVLEETAVLPAAAAEVPDVFVYLVYRWSSSGRAPSARSASERGIVVAWTRLSARQLLRESSLTGDAHDTGVGAPRLRWLSFGRDPLTEELAHRELSVPPDMHAGELLARVALVRVVPASTPPPPPAQHGPSKSPPLAQQHTPLAQQQQQQLPQSATPRAKSRLPKWGALRASLVLRASQIRRQRVEERGLGKLPRSWREMPRALPELRFSRRRIIVHVLQARALPSADSDGLVDPCASSLVWRILFSLARITRLTASLCAQMSAFSCPAPTRSHSRPCVLRRETRCGTRWSRSTRISRSSRACSRRSRSRSATATASQRRPTTRASPSCTSRRPTRASARSPTRGGMAGLAASTPTALTATADQQRRGCRQPGLVCGLEVDRRRPAAAAAFVAVRSCSRLSLTARRRCGVAAAGFSAPSRRRSGTPRRHLAEARRVSRRRRAVPSPPREARHPCPSSRSPSIKTRPERAAARSRRRSRGRLPARSARVRLWSRCACLAHATCARRQAWAPKTRGISRAGRASRSACSARAAAVAAEFDTGAAMTHARARVRPATRRRATQTTASACFCRARITNRSCTYLSTRASRQCSRCMCTTGALTRRACWNYRARRACSRASGS